MALIEIPANPPPAAPIVLLSSAEVRRRLGGIGKTAFFELRRSDPTFPKPCRFSLDGRDKYVESEVNAWIEAQTKQELPPRPARTPKPETRRAGTATK